MIIIKPEFHIEDYSEGTVMHCPTLESANIFCQLLHENGRRWNSGQSYAEFNHWHDYGKDTCYNFQSGFYGEYGDYFDDDDEDYYTILEFDDFDWSSFLKEPDIEPSESITEFLSTFGRI